MTLGKGGRSFTRPHHGIERKPGDHLRVALREQSAAQGAGGNPVNEKRAIAAQLLDIARGREAVVGAISDRRVVVAGLRGAAISLQVEAPGVVAARGEEI